MKNIIAITACFLAATLHAQPAPDTTLVELPAQRTDFSKTYFSSRDNTFTTHLSSSYIHYLDSDGTYRDIDTQLRQDSTGAYVTGPGLYRVTFANSLGRQNQYDIVWEVPRPVHAKFRPPNAPPLPPAELRWKVLSYGYFERLSYIYQTLENAAAAAPFVSGSEINYPQIFHGVTVRFTCSSGRLKEEIVFSQTARDSLVNPSRYGLSPNDTYLMFAAEIDLWPGNIKAMAQTPSGKVPIRNGNRFAFNGTDQIDFEDAQENLYFSLPNDYAWAANDNTGENIVPVLRVFTTQQGRHYLYLGVPWSWVNAAPTGPLIIDPTITIDDNLDDVTRDTRLQNAAKWGSDATLIVGKKSDSVKKRTLIKFDFAYSGIPGNATILNSELQLYYYDAQRAGSSAWVDRWVQAHQVLNNWDELQADSLKRLTGTNWLAPRGKIGPGSNPASEDANGQFESTMLFQTGQTGTWKVWNLTALTQKWINGTAANNGVILWATNEDVNAYDLRFYSRENATNKPKLVVTWSNTPKTVYFLKDHLGSLRATVLDSATAPVRGYDDYDPWGYALALRTKATPYTSLQAVAKNKFTGKEWDDEFGVNWNYFGARYYDPQIGRWLIVDRFANKYPSLTPYHYAADNPVFFVDPTGDTLEIIGNEQQRKLALEAIQAGLPKNVRKAVQIVEVNGRYFIDDKVLNKARKLSDSDEFLALRQIVNSPALGQLQLLDKNAEFRYFDKTIGTTVAKTFETLIPGAEVFGITFTTDIANTIYDRTSVVSSIPGVNQVFVNSSRNWETIVQYTAHELYGHLRPHFLGQRASHYQFGDVFDQRIAEIMRRALQNYRSGQ